MHEIRIHGWLVQGIWTSVRAGFRASACECPVHALSSWDVWLGGDWLWAAIRLCAASLGQLN